MIEGYFEQLTAEKLVTKYVKGFPVRSWTKKSGARNEALDTFVYSLAALQALYFRFNRRTIWEQLRGRMTVKVQKTVERDERPLQVNRPRRKVRQNSSFVQNW